jgi:hypothetical protein
LVGHRLGWLVVEIRLTFDGDRFVDAHTIAGPPPGKPPPTAEERLVYTCAGFVAESINVGLDPRLGVRRAIEQGSRDGDQIVQLLSELGPASDAGRFLDDAIGVVADLLETEWDELRRIAETAAREGVCHFRPAPPS